MAAELGAGARAYQEIKQAILSGDLKQRQKLEIDELAARYRVSATPVRHALAVLTSERLAVVHPARGYSVAFWTERELADLYEWRWQLARLAAESFQSGSIERAAGSAYAEDILGVLGWLHTGANGEVRAASNAADERLRAAYRAEPHVLPNTGKELAALEASIAGGDLKRTLQRLRLFFRRRIADCAAIRARAGVSALPRNGD